MVEFASSMVIPCAPLMVTFKPKFNLPKLEDYRGIFPAAYWAKWKKNTVASMMPGKSWISSLALRDLAARAEFPHRDMLDRVCERLDNRARLGAGGRARLATSHPNSKAVFQFGDRVSDSLQEAICDKIICGPLKQEELPWDDYTLNPIGGKLKPNGKLRLLVDASSPHDRDDSVPGWLWNPVLPGSVNSTINIEDYPTKMSSVSRLVRALWRQNGCQPTNTKMCLRKI
jgi:hypothetical protein